MSEARAEKSEGLRRPPIEMICYNDEHGNPHTFTVGRGVSEIKETEECGEYCLIPWVEVWDGTQLVARFCQHKLEHIFYRRQA